jgi:uncharacterized membrane protein YoaK (UPF0700 family)
VAAGCVDAVSFLGLGQVLTVAMTGNTVLLGLALGQADAEAALRSTVALLGFFAGTLLGAAIADRGPGIWSPVVAAALAIELVLLIGFATTWQLAGGQRWIGGHFALIAAAGLAMGLQSAVAHRAGVGGIATTYVTGTLTTLATRLIGSLRRRPREVRVEETTPVWFPATVWLAYGLGAVLAGAACRWWPAVALDLGIGDDLRWPSVALVVPIVIVALAVSIIVGRWARGATA